MERGPERGTEGGRDRGLREKKGQGWLDYSSEAEQLQGRQRDIAKVIQGKGGGEGGKDGWRVAYVELNSCAW